VTWLCRASYGKPNETIPAEAYELWGIPVYPVMFWDDVNWKPPSWLVSKAVYWDSHKGFRVVNHPSVEISDTISSETFFAG